MLNQKTVKVYLKNIDGDAVYAAEMNLGSPISQTVNLIFDTGSEFLAVTSNFCDDDTASGYNFKRYNPINFKFESREKTQGRCGSKAFDTRKSKSKKLMST